MSALHSCPSHTRLAWAKRVRPVGAAALAMTVRCGGGTAPAVRIVGLQLTGVCFWALCVLGAARVHLQHKSLAMPVPLRGTWLAEAT